MAVVTSNSDLYRDDLSTDNPVEAMRLKGVLRASIGSVANLATDSSGSMYKLGEIPSYAILSEDTFFDVENWGFAQVVIGTKTDTDALLDVARSAATTQSPIAIGDANHGKRFWEVLGLAADPGGVIPLYAHAEAGATGAGTMLFRLAFYDQK